MRTSRMATALTATTLITVLTASCGHDSESRSAAEPTPAGSTASRTAPAQPALEGIAAFGTPASVAGDWIVELRTPEKTEAPADSQSLPSGWTALRTTMRFTNRADHISMLPRTVLTMRYGADGRAAVLFSGAGLPGLPERGTTTRVKPGGSFAADIGLAVPAAAAGERATATAEVTKEGMAEAENLFFEGTLPGQAASTAPGSSSSQGPAAGATVPLGTWSTSGLRLSPISLAQGEAGGRRAELELSVANKSADPKKGMGVSLRILTGDALKQVASVTPGLGYKDAPIAPNRTATAMVRFTIPDTTVPGPITVEAITTGGTRTTFDGTLR
ncbi:hypothetical protein [Streptomyces aureoversilis]|uniref:DUF4352 domain-containing protein n=1 Tax=Streptomyces aureoversilis TaxID=67277 RepID=A0ABW0A8D6_9ACTN